MHRNLVLLALLALLTIAARSHAQDKVGHVGGREMPPPPPDRIVEDALTLFLRKTVEQPEQAAALKDWTNKKVASPAFKKSFRTNVVEAAVQAGAMARPVTYVSVGNGIVGLEALDEKEGLERVLIVDAFAPTKRIALTASSSRTIDSGLASDGTLSYVISTRTGVSALYYGTTAYTGVETYQRPSGGTVYYGRNGDRWYRFEIGATVTVPQLLPASFQPPR